MMKPSIENESKKKISKKAVIKRILIQFLAIFIAYNIFAISSGLIFNKEFMTAFSVWQHDVQERIALYIEEIDGVFCEVGTIDELIAAGNSIYSDAENNIIRIVNAYYDHMIGGVDTYLDGYYSMFGQWKQLWNMVSGLIRFGNLTEGISEYMSAELEKAIAPDYDLQGVIDDILLEASEEFKTTYNQIIEKNRILDTEGFEKITTMTVSFDDVLEVCTPDFNNHMKTFAVGTASGVVTNMIAKKIVKNVMAKSVSKQAAKGLTSKILAKAAGFLTGPVGGIIIGLGTDFILVEADEALNRENYRNAIIESIENARQEQLAAVADVFDGVKNYEL